MRRGSGETNNSSGGETNGNLYRSAPLELLMDFAHVLTHSNIIKYAFDEFKRILCRAEGTGYADFIEVLVDLEVDRSEEYHSLIRKTVCSPGA